MSAYVVDIWMFTAILTGGASGAYAARRMLHALWDAHDRDLADRVLGGIFTALGVMLGLVAGLLVGLLGLWLSSLLS